MLCVNFMQNTIIDSVSGNSDNTIESFHLYCYWNIILDLPNPLIESRRFLDVGSGILYK